MNEQASKVTLPVHPIPSCFIRLEHRERDRGCPTLGTPPPRTNIEPSQKTDSSQSREAESTPTNASSHIVDRRKKGVIRNRNWELGEEWIMSLLFNDNNDDDDDDELLHAKIRWIASNAW